MDPIVCLCMIVKDEAHIIARALAPVRPWIDSWVIVDTGSTDDTEAQARAALANIPGEYHTHAWTGYADARNRSLELAEQITAGRPAYAFLIDADDVWEGELDKSQLTAPAHCCWISKGEGTKRWVSPRFLRLDIGWRYRDIAGLHEYIVSPTPQPRPLIDCVRGVSTPDGATWKDPDKYRRMAKALAAHLADNPLDTRAAFYLGQAYQDAGEVELAASAYLRRATMWPSGDPEEVYVSYLMAGRAFAQLCEWSLAKKALDAADNLPWCQRTEAALELAKVLLVKVVTQQSVGGLFVEEPPATTRAALDSLFPKEAA